MVGKFMSKLFSILLLAACVSGCSHPQQFKNQLKSVQVFQSNSGSNYIFESKK